MAHVLNLYLVMAVKSTVVKKILGEARPSRASEVAAKISALPGFEKVDVWSQSDGYSVLIRSTEGADAGQAYEVQIRPAAYAKHPSMKDHYGTGRGTVRQKPTP